MRPSIPVHGSRVSRRSLWRLLRVTASLTAMVIAAVVVAGRTDEIRGAGNVLQHLQRSWIVAALVAEALALLSFAALQRLLLASGNVSMGLGAVGAITLGGTALQNSLPGGAAVASVWAFRQYRLRGADDVLAAWMLMAVSVLSGVSIAFLAAVGVALSAGQAASYDLVVVVMVTLGVAAGMVVAIKQGALSAVVRRSLRLSQRVTGRPKGGDEAVAVVVRRLHAVTPVWHDWLIAAAMALANWAWDCGALVCAFLAVGSTVPWRGLLLAYGAAQLASNLPLTPGGLGIVEGSLTVALVAYGGGRSSTVAAVLLYRIISFWLLLPVGWLAAAALAWRNRRVPRRQP